MSAGQVADVCPVIKKLISEENDIGLAKHMIQLCFHCLRKRLLDRFESRRFIYEDEPPPWIVVTDKVEENIPCQKDRVNENPRKTRKRKQKDVKTVIPIEELDQHLYKRSFELSDAQLTFEIIKLKKLSKESAHAFMIQLRQRAKSEKQGLSTKAEEINKITNPPEFLPWCPSIQSLFPRGFISVLNQREQLRFLGICQSISNHGTLRFAHNLKESKDFRKRTLHERERMEVLILDMIENDLEQKGAISKSHPLIYTHGLASKFILARCEKRWCNETSNYKFDRNNVTTVDWKFRNVRRDSEIRPKLVSTVLKGRSDRLRLPNLQLRCPLDASRLHTDFPISLCNKDRIFDDLETVTSLCLENDIRIAMDGTTACHLMSDPFVGHGYSYAIPIRVIQKVIKGKVANIAVLAKPSVLNSVDRATIQRQFIKYLLKSAYIHQRREPVVNSSVTDRLTSNKPISEATSELCDPLSTILPSLDLPSNHKQTNSAINISENCKTYSIFSIGGSNILVRSRPPPLCTEGHQSLRGLPISFEPRLEYVPNAGAMRLSEAESMWNYCKGIFKQSSVHVLFRTHYSLNHVLQLQHWEMQDLTPYSESERIWTGPLSKQESAQLISRATTRFSRLLEVISDLSHGNYMLVNNNDGSLQILNQAIDEAHSNDVLECCDVKISVSELSARFSDSFNGLEPMIPLQWQVIQNRAPGCFVAPDSKLKVIAQTPHPGSIDNAKNNKKKGRTRNQRRRRNLKSMQPSHLPGSSKASVANSKSDEPTAYCPFGISTEANSAASTSATSSPFHSPERLVIDHTDS